MHKTDINRKKLNDSIWNNKNLQALKEASKNNIWEHLSFEQKCERTDYVIEQHRRWCKGKLKSNVIIRFRNWLWSFRKIIIYSKERKDGSWFHIYIPISLLWRLGKSVYDLYEENYPERIPELYRAIGFSLARPIMVQMNYESFARQIFKVEPLENIK